MCLVEIWREMCDFCRRSECDPLSGVQAGVYGGRCDGERVREGLGWGSQQHSGEDSPGWWQGILPYGGSLVSSFHSNSYKKKTLTSLLQLRSDCIYIDQPRPKLYKQLLLFPAYPLMYGRPFMPGKKKKKRWKCILMKTFPFLIIMR